MTVPRETLITDSPSVRSELMTLLVASNESFVGARARPVQVCHRTPDGRLVAGISATV